MTERVDVVVVGAGLAGLSAALRLGAHGLSVAVLEAADEVGGRTRSRWVNGAVVDFGGEWLGPRHTYLRGLVRHLGLHLTPARLLGRPVRWRGNGVDHVSCLPPPAIAADVVRAVLAVERLAWRIDPRRPWASPGAVELDGVSAAEWGARQRIGGHAYRYLSGVIEMLSSTPVDQLSLLHVLWWIRRGGGLVGTLRTTFHSRVAEGAQAVAERAAGRLGGRVRLGARVCWVGQAGDVEVGCADGSVVRARSAVVTGCLGRVPVPEFDPPLPPELRALDEIRIDPGAKISALLPPGRTPAHRIVLGGQPIGAAWRYGRRISGFALCEAQASDADLRADLAEAYQTSAGELRDVVVFRWDNHPSIGGCDVGFAPGQLTRFGPRLTQPHGRVFFAGAERSSWPNNMEGAVESGVATADRVAAALAR